MVEEQPSRLKGKGLERLRAAKLLLTDDLTFGAFGSGIGNLNLDGYEARISNSSSGQDALAISKDARVFVIADGLGGAGAGFDTRAVSGWARGIAEAVARRGRIGDLTRDRDLKELMADVKKNIEAKGIDFKSRSRMRSAIRGIKTTLTAVERTDERTFTTLAIGDSPLYVIDKSTGAIIRQWGEDAIKGETDSPLENAVGMDQDGNFLSLDNPAFVVKDVIDVQPNQLIVLGSDFFSDHTSAHRNLKEYVGLTPEQFHAKATGPERVKGDDATLIVIDPERLPWRKETP